MHNIIYYHRFLWRENYVSKDLFDEVVPQIERSGGTLSVDDMVIDKLYSDPNKAELIDYFWGMATIRELKGHIDIKSIRWWSFSYLNSSLLLTSITISNIYISIISSTDNPSSR